MYPAHHGGLALKVSDGMSAAVPVGKGGYLFTEWGFRVGLSSWIFELDFRVGLSSWIFELDF